MEDFTDFKHAVEQDSKNNGVEIDVNCSEINILFPSCCLYKDQVTDSSLTLMIIDSMGEIKYMISTSTTKWIGID